MNQSVPDLNDLCRAFVDGARESMIAIDESGTIVFENDAATRFTAGPDREGTHSIYDRLHPDDVVAMRVAIDRSRDPRESAAFVDCHLRHRDGRWIPVEALVRTIERRGESRHVLLQFRDISESLTMRARLRQLQRLGALGRLTIGVADDFTRVVETIRRQLDHLPLSDAAPFGLRVIRKAAETGAALVQQLRAFADASLAPRQAIDVHAVLRDLQRSLSSTVWFDLQLDAPASTVRAERDGLRQGLHDLVVGFVNAMPDGSIVSVATRNLPTSRHPTRTNELTAVVHLVIEVSNTAQALRPIAPSRVFEPRADLPVTTAIMLALVVLDDVCVTAGGFVEVSANANGGTVVTINLVCE